MCLATKHKLSLEVNWESSFTENKAVNQRTVFFFWLFHTSYVMKILHIIPLNLKWKTNWSTANKGSNLLCMSCVWRWLLVLECFAVCSWFVFKGKSTSTGWSFKMLVIFLLLLLNNEGKVSVREQRDIKEEKIEVKKKKGEPSHLSDFKS